METYNCGPCNAQFKYCEDIRKITILFTIVNDQAYKVTILPNGIFITQIISEMVNGEEIKTVKIVSRIDLNDMPNINPFNVNRKVRIILVFS